MFTEAHGGRGVATTLAQRPEPKEPVGRRPPRKDPLPEEHGIGGAKGAMATFVKARIQQGGEDSVRAEKKFKLEEERFHLDVKTNAEARAEARANAARQQAIDEARVKLEQDRLANEKSYNESKILNDSKREANEHALAVMKEQNRSKEAIQAAALAKAQSDNMAAQTAMLMKLVESIANKSN